mmetsp:Transcript_174/g.493  ORF Transcript_174/g.493 Transcript_174/m.493 type:complete len:378 (-) Transcript_174:73-1206(-)
MRAEAFVVSEEEGSGLACAAFEVDPFVEDEYVDPLLLNLLADEFDAEEELRRLAAADDAVARWFAELDDDDDALVASDEAIARCLAADLAADFAADDAAARARTAPTYSQALRTGLRPLTEQPPPSDDDDGWTSARRSKHDKKDEESPRPRTAAELRVAALEMHRAASAFREAAIRSRAVRGPSAILARDRAAAQREGWLRRRDAAAALFFAANNADLVAAWCGTTFRDAVSVAAAELARRCGGTVDFHMLSTAEAVLALGVVLGALAAALPQPRRVSVTVVAGRGTHSANGAPKLAPAVRHNLDRHWAGVFAYHEVQQGTFLVRPTAADHRRRPQSHPTSSSSTPSSPTTTIPKATSPPPLNRKQRRRRRQQQLRQ